MEVTPGYKQTDVGVIPEEWEVKRLGDLFEITSSKRVFQSEWKTQGVPFYRARELAVLDESGAVHNELFVTQKMYDAFKRTYGVPDAGDMLVTGVGTLGKVYVVSGDHEFYFKDGNIIWFKIAGSVSTEFLRQLYSTPLIKKQISDASAGTTVGTYTITGAKKTVIPFPPPSEQRAIAEALRDVDALLAALDRLIAKKRDLKQAATQQLLTGQTRLPGFKHNGKFKQTDAGSVPEDWKVETVGQISTVGRGRVISHREIATAMSHLYPVYSSQTSDHGIMGYIDTFDFEGEYITWTTDGANAGTVFHRNGRFNCTNVCGTIKLKKDNAEFVSKVLARIAPRHVSRNLGNPKLMNEVAKCIPVPLPPTVEEQNAIADALTVMDAELGALERRREKTRNLKQAIMQELLTGRTRLI